MATTTAGDGTTIDYEVWGAGDGDDAAVILVHGITEQKATWEPVHERLAESRRVIGVDLRGHGASGTAARYDLEAMAGDVAAVAMAAHAERPHVVGHSLGGAVVSALGAAFPVSSVVCVDQPLQLGAFKAQVESFEDQLRDPDAFESVMTAMFDLMAGELLSDDESARVKGLRRPDQGVVLGVWNLLLTQSVEEIEATVDQAMAGYRGQSVPYLAVFGLDPGAEYETWLRTYIDGAVVDTWADHGHYPHLVDPDRFVARLDDFWG